MTRLHRIARLITAALSPQIMETVANRYGVPVETVDAIQELILGRTHAHVDLLVEWAAKNIAAGSYRYPEDNFRIWKAWHFVDKVKKKDPRTVETTKRLFPGKNAKNVLDFTLQDVERVDEDLSGPEYDPKVNNLQTTLPEGSEMVYNEGGWQVVKITNEYAACTLGKGTSWCTRRLDDDSGEPEIARDHLSASPLFIIYKGGKKMAQFHLGSNPRSTIQIKDLKDDDIDLGASKELKEVFARSGLFSEVLDVMHGYDSMDANVYYKLFGSGENSEAVQKVIATNSYASFFYADEIGKRFPLGEPAIAKDPDEALSYAENLKVRIPVIEKKLADHPQHAYMYAQRVLHDRFPAGEKAIFRDHNATRWYRQFLIDIGKEDEVQWPEENTKYGRNIYRRPS